MFKLPIQPKDFHDDLHRKFPLKKIPAAILAVLLATSSSYAIAVGASPTDNSWQGSDGDDFSTPSFWSEGVVPGNSHNAILTVSGQNQTVILNGLVSFANGLIDGTNNGSMILDHQSGNLSTGLLEVGKDGVGAYNLGVGAGLNVDHLGLGVNGNSRGTFTNKGGSVNVLGGATLVVGDAGTGVYNQSSGTTNDTNLILGNQATGNGTVNLTGGDIAISGDTIVGNLGTGTFNQDSTSEASTHTVGGNLILGAQAGSTGNYNLDNGTVDVGTPIPGSGSLVVGDSGNGTMVQNGGTINILNNDINTNAFVVGNHAGSVGTFTQSGGAVNGGRALAIGLDGGTGTYNLNTGTNPTLDTGFIALGNNSGQGAFNQQADTTNTTDSLFIGSQGTYNLDGGSLTTTGAGIGQGTIVGTSGSGALFNQTGGTHTANNLVVGNRSDGNGSYLMSGGDLVVNDVMYVGLGHDNPPSPTGVVNGLFKQSAGTVTAAQIAVGGHTEVIPHPTDPLNNPPTFIQHLGTGRYELSGGVVNSSFTVVGESSNGQVQQTGGTFNAGALQIGSDGLFSINNDLYSSGVYDLQGGILNTTGTIVSVFGLGTFNQSGAASQHNVGGNLVVGSQPAYIEPVSGQVDQGKYNLFDGALSVQGNTIIGAGNNNANGLPGALGTFTQTGGAHTVTGDLIVGQEGTGGAGAGGTGIYSISAGTLEVLGTLRLSENNNNGAVGGNATFEQTGGVVTASGFDQQGNNGASSSYTLNGGTLNSGGGGMSDASTFNHTGGTHNTGGFTIGGSGGSDYDTVYNITGPTAVANFNDLTVGGLGIGIMNQSDGAVNVTGQIVVGHGPNLDPLKRYGAYNLSDGTLAAANSLVIGAGNGVVGDPGFPGEPGGLGTFTQTGGDVHVGTDLILGQVGDIGSGTGSYTLSGGGQVQIDRNAVVGDGGAGTFIQSDNSTVQVNGQVAVGANDGSNGHYTINNNAALTIAGALEVGGSADLQTTVNGGTGVVTQNGGAVTVGNGLFIGQYGGAGSYELNNGTLESLGIGAPVVFVGQNSVGALTQTGGNLITHNLNVGLVSGSTAAYNMSGGSIDTTFLTVGSVGSTASFEQSDSDGDSDVLVHGDLVLDSGGSYQLSQSGNLSTLKVDGATVVGIDGAATFDQTGGTHDTAHLVLGANATGNGTYNLSGGTLNDDAIVGDAGTGLVNNSGGTHNVTGNLVLGNQMTGDGTYELSGTGVVSVSGSTTVGNEGVGHFIQSAGSHIVADNLAVGDGINGTGTYQLGGTGVVTANDLHIAENGTGTYGQTAGTTTVASEVFVGRNNGGVGVINLSGGSFSAGWAERVGVETGSIGTFNQSGGTNTVGDLVVGDKAGSTGTYLLSAGNLNATNTLVGNSGTGVFNQSGGTHDTAHLVLGANATGNGTYNLSGGTLNDDAIVGDAGTGTVNNSGGTHNVTGDLILGNQVSGDGTYNLSGTGVTTVSNNAIIGNAGNGEMNLSGNASLSVIGNVVVANMGTATGALNVAGGTLVAPNINNNGQVNYSGGAITANVNNNGGFSVSGGAERTLTGNLSNNTGGTVTVGTGSPLVVSGVLTNNTGANIEANDNITVGTDYNNLNSGSGNTYNNHANVMGGGLILAAGAGAATAQTLSGDIVGGGTTSNDATIAFGNVHVGDTLTKNYQIGNANTGGPDLRGAIQTTANGGNITDARLSGTGVTAGVFGPIAAGGNSGGLGVTLTATSAGALTGQQVHILNNFDNTNAQNLSLTGAAYNLASASSASPNPVTLANQREGGSASQALTVSNTAATGLFTEKLNGSVTGATGNANGTGSFSLLAAGDSSTNISVGVDASSAGHKSGAVTLGLVSDGSGTSGLGQTALASQTVNVSGDVYRLAQGSTTPDPVVFGNRHVGDTASQVLTVQNTAATDGFSESLNANFSGSTGAASHNSGTINLLAAGGSDSSAMIVGLDTSSAGAKSGSVGINYVSDGAGTSGLAAITAGGQTVDVSGSVYRLASANTLAAVNFGNVHVGDSVNQALSISNTAVNDGFSEKLNASFGTSSDVRITNNGNSILQLGAGLNDSSMSVGLNTTAAGNVNGTQTVLFKSDGTGTSGLGLTDLPSQNVGVTGDITTSASVFRLASASAATPNPVDFGNVRINSATDQALSISNTAANDGFSEKLNASISSNGAPVTASGAFNLLGPQATDSTNLHVGIDTASAGVKSGAATIALVSDGTGTSGLASTTLASQTVDVSGAVYRLADPVLNTGSVLLNARVGDASPTAGISISNQSPDIFTEGLKASASTASAGFSGGGTISNLGAGGTDASSLQVALNTGAAGNFNGTMTTSFTSTGAGTTNAVDVSVGSADTTLAGKVYQGAAASVTNAPIDFGIVHVGDVVATQALSVSNAAPVVALNDTLQGSLAGAAGPFTASGSFTGLVAGGTDSASLVTGLNTATAGIFNGSATASFTSHNPDMADLALPGVAVQLLGTVNNYANPDFALVSGAGSLAGGGLSFNLNFGSVLDDTGIVDLFLSMANDVFGPADLIDGSYDLTGADEFLLNGFNSFVNLGAGMVQNGLKISFDTNALGLGAFTDTVLLNVRAHNASGYADNFQVRLNLAGQITNNGGGNVPEPESLLLMIIGLSGLLAARRRMMA